MPSTMDELQQLTNNELFILCHKYHIAAHKIAYLTRRQLERRLHVAIIAERAKLRAHELVNTIRNQQDQMDLHNWFNEHYPHNQQQHPMPVPSRQMPLPSWRNFAAGWQGYNLSTSQRFRGGVDYLKHLERLRRYTVDEGQQCLEDESEQAMKQQWQDEHENLVEPLSAMSTEIIEWDVNKEIATDYYSLSNDEESRSNASIECVTQNELQKGEKFAWWTISSHDVRRESEHDGDSSSERVLCTINYLDELQPGDHIQQKRFNDYDDYDDDDLLENSENFIIGDTLPSNPTTNRQQRSFWRYILELICWDSEGKLDAAKLQYSILCCAMVICTYIGMKWLP